MREPDLNHESLSLRNLDTRNAADAGS
jgi:hypothetical protein